MTTWAIGERRGVRGDHVLCFGGNKETSYIYLSIYLARCTWRRRRGHRAQSPPVFDRAVPPAPHARTKMCAISTRR